MSKYVYLEFGKIFSVWNVGHISNKFINFEVNKKWNNFLGVVLENRKGEELCGYWDYRTLSFNKPFIKCCLQGRNDNGWQILADARAYIPAFDPLP